MSEELMVSKALESNTFSVAGGSGASYINPNVWISNIEEFATKKLVMAPLGRTHNELLGQVGTTLTLQYNSEITAAAIVETTAITPSAYSYTQVTFTPTEYAVAVGLTRKEKIRSIQDIMMEKTKDMGYALAKVKDSLIFTRLVAGNGNAVVANGVAVSAIASSDTLDQADLANAVSSIKVDDFKAKYIVIHPACENALLKLSNFIDVSVYGSRETVINGEIGKYLGMKVLTSTNVPVNATTSTAYDNFVLDSEAFGIATKMGITFNSDYKILEREFLLAAVEEYDVQVIQANKICKLTAYGM